MTSTGSQPPATRERAASMRATEAEDDKLDSIVEAVVSRLRQAGLAMPAAESPGAAAASKATTEVGRPAAVMKAEPEEEEVGVPSASRRRLWLEELKTQLSLSPHFGIREREETRGLLVIGEAAGPPPEHRSWYW